MKATLTKRQRLFAFILLISSNSLFAQTEVPPEFRDFVGTYENMGGTCPFNNPIVISYESRQPIYEENYERGPHLLRVKTDTIRDIVMGELYVNGDGRFAIAKFEITLTSLKHEFMSNIMRANFSLILQTNSENIFDLVTSGTAHSQMPECFNTLKKIK